MNTPEDLVSRMLYNIRGQFCADMSTKEWAQNSHFIRRNVILWPARFMTGKGFTLPASRYEKILLEILSEVKSHGRTGAIKYWPGYLMKCVQDHWRHHWEEYYQEAKSIRTLSEAAMLACKAVPERQDPTVEALAMAHRVLVRKKTEKRAPSTPKQLGLFHL